MPRATVSPERLQTLTDTLSKLAIAAQVEPALTWAAGLAPEERKALLPVTQQMHQRPTGKDSRNWEQQRKLTRLVNALCAQKPKELVDEHWNGGELRQLLAHGPLPWLDLMRSQANRRGWLGLGLSWIDEHWLTQEGHVSEPLTDRLRAELIGTYPFVAGFDYRHYQPLPAPALSEVPAEFWQHDFWLLFTHPLGPQAAVTPDSQQRDAWIPAFVSAAGQAFPREVALARLLASLQIPALKQNQIHWQVQLLNALAPTAAEWSAHPSELLLALASPLSTVQALGLQAWQTLVQAELQTVLQGQPPSTPLPLDALLQELGLLWAVKTKAIHKQTLSLLALLAQRIAAEPDTAQASALHQLWRDTAVLGLVQADASHQKQLLQLLSQQVSDEAELGALLASSSEWIGQAGRQWLAKTGISLDPVVTQTGVEANTAHAAGADSSSGADPQALAAWCPPAASPGAEPEPVSVAPGTFEDWALDLVAALRADGSTTFDPTDLARWYRALQGLAHHLPGLTPAQLTQLGPAWMAANSGAASGMAVLFVAQLKLLAAASPALQTELTRLTDSAKGQLSWINRCQHATALSEALAQPALGPLLQGVRWRLQSQDAALRALPLLSAPSHTGGRVSVPALLARVAALAQAGMSLEADHAEDGTGTALHADLQLALHRLWLPAATSAAHAEAVAACEQYAQPDQPPGVPRELLDVLAWLLSGQHQLPTPFTPAFPAWWADAALAHGRALEDAGLQLGEHPLALYAGLAFQLANMRVDDPQALAPELTLTEADLSYPSKKAEALLSGLLQEHARELELAELAPYLIQLRPERYNRAEPQELVAQTSAQQMQQMAGNAWAADAVRRFRTAYRHLRLGPPPAALWVERALESLRSTGGARTAMYFLPTMPALWSGAWLGDFQEISVGAITCRAPRWPEAPALRYVLSALDQHPEQQGPWDDARYTLLALALSDKDAATRLQAMALLPTARATRQHTDPQDMDAASAPAALGRVLALLLRNLQISLPRLAEGLRQDALPEPGYAPLVASLLLFTLAQLPAKPLRGLKALLELAGDALGQCSDRSGLLQALPAPLSAALDARLQSWSSAGSNKAAAKALAQLLS